MLTLAATSCYALAPEARASNQTGRQKSLVADPNCGTLNDLAKRVDACAKPLMDLLQGTVEKWPRNEEDAATLCNSFAASERCIRETSRKCAKGIHKTITSTLANSIQRARKRECGKGKATAIVKTTTCIEKNQDTVHVWMNNVTSRLLAIETQTTDATKMINALCCIVRDIESEIKAILSPLCYQESQMVVRLYRSVLEDVIELICRNPKCDGYLKPYKVKVTSDFNGMISILLRIVFSLDI